MAEYIVMRSDNKNGKVMAENHLDAASKVIPVGMQVKEVPTVQNANLIVKGARTTKYYNVQSDVFYAIIFEDGNIAAFSSVSKLKGKSPYDWFEKHCYEADSVGINASQYLFELTYDQYVKLKALFDDKQLTECQYTQKVLELVDFNKAIDEHDFEY